MKRRKEIMKKTVTALFLVVMIFVGFGSAQAAVSTYNNRTAFEAQGTIAYNYGFEDFTGSSVYYPGNPWTSHDVTYTSLHNVIVGPTYGYGNASNVIISNIWTPLTGDINGSYRMLGFDLGVLGYTSALDLQIYTNAGTYTFNGLIVPNVTTSMDFYGFKTSTGEYFTGFRLDSQGGLFYAPAIDNVTLGNPVPIPSAILLLGPGLLGLAGLRRRFMN
jgi:hypothetical protein